MPQSRVSAPLTRQQAYSLADAISEIEDLALAVSAYEDEKGEWMFEALCEGEPDLSAFDAVARDVLGGKVDFSADRIDPDTDWIARSLQGLPPVEAGGFFIHASHNADRIPARTIPIRIEAAQAFGTGHHETTMGCLRAIDEIVDRQHPENCLDVGTGTGVLAIALAKRLQRHIMASDIDPIAVETTLDNARLNGVEKQITCVQAAGLDHETIRAKSPFDLIVANILAAPLAQLAPDISRATAKGSTLVLSGLLNTQAADIQETYARHGFALEKRLPINDWTTLVLCKAD